MDMDQAAVFFAGSILTMLGFIIIVAGVVAINNILHKYWKPVTWVKYEYEPVYFDAKDGTPLVKTPQKTPKDVK